MQTWNRPNFLNVCVQTTVTFFTVALLSTAALAQDATKNVLKSINKEALQGGKVILKIEFKDPLTVLPAGFTVTNPARIALDLPNTLNGMGRNNVDIGEGDVRSVNIAEVANRTRLVVNLAQALSYTAALQGNSLLLTVDAAPKGSVKEGSIITRFGDTPPPQAASVRKQSIRDVDFRRGPNGEGRISFDLSSASIVSDIRQQGRNVIVDFANTSAPRNLIRRLDVNDFSTPVKTVELLEQGTNTRAVIEPKGLWEWSAYQTDTLLVLEIKTLKEDPNKLVQGTAGYSGEKLSLNFQSIEIRPLLQVIADFTGLNIIASDTANGTLTLRLKDVPWDQALDIILQSKGLSKRKNGNVVLIAPTDELATKEKLELEANQQKSELEPLRTESFPLSYAKASDVQPLLAGASQKILSKRGSATVDPRTNTLFIQDVPTRLEEVRRLINQLDVPVRQVQIEARIVIADEKFGRQLGARFGTGAGLTQNGRNIGVGGNITSSSAIANGATPGNQLNVDLPVAGAAGSLGFTFLNLGNGNIVNLELSALESDNRGKVVSNPRIVTSDKKKAVITQGTEIGYFTQSASGGSTIAFKQAVLSLEVTPQITPDDKVIMDLDIKKDAVGAYINYEKGSIPSIDTKGLKTQILVDNGDTAVLGGIFELVTRTDVTKVPFLGDIPILGNLFKTSRKQEDKTELLIFITPRIIKDQLNIR